jgi:hypothetical protein
MIDDAVLAALAGAVEQDGDVELSLAALRRVDPLLRDQARRRLRDAHADALLATRVKQDPEGARHALRLTYLLVAGELPPRASRDDVAAIGAAFAAAHAARPPARGGFWWPTALVVLGMVAAVGVVATVATSRLRASAAVAALSATASERPAPPVRGAFAEGGVPAKSPGDDALARALGTDAPDFLVALDHRADARRAGTPGPLAQAETAMREARARALSTEVREALGPGAAAALDALLSAAEVASVGGAGGTTATETSLAAAAATLDDELAAQGLGYFIDADVITDTDTGHRLVLVYAFRVARVSVFSAGRATVRALALRRLDKLNWSHTLLGFTRPTLRYAAVLLDQLDDQILTMIAPGLAPGASVPLFEPDSPPAVRSAVEARAGELVRAEYGALPGLDTAAAVKLGKLLDRRRALFARWEKIAAAQGMTLVVPAKLPLPDGFRESVKGLVPAEDLTELAAITGALEDRTRADAFEALRDALTSSVERHEVQHRLDALGPQPPPMPPALEARVGPLVDHGKERRGAATARAELSAYLAELARDARTPRVGLTLIARFLFDRRMHGAPECYAALTILEGLAAELGVRVEAPLLSRGAIDQHAVAAVWTGLVALPPERLREAARKLWESLFATPLPDLHRTAPVGDSPG